jgi:ATP-binding cassette subfamily B protein
MFANPKLKTSFRALLRGTWESTIDERPRFFLFIILFIAAYSLDLLVPLAMGYTIGVFVEHGLTHDAFQLALWGIAAATILRFGNTLFHHSARYVQNRVAYSARMHTLNKIFGALLKFPLRWHVETHSGENLSKLHRTAGAIDSMIGTYVWQIIEGMVKVVFAGVALFTLDFWVATNVLAMAALTIVAMVLFNKKLTVKIRRNNLFGNKLNRVCVDYLFNIVTVKTLGVEDAAIRHVRAQRDEGLQLSQKISKYMELKWGSTGVGYAIVIGTSLLIYFSRHQSMQQAIDVAQVYVLLNYLDRIFQAIGSFTGYYSGIVEASTAYEDATDLYDQAARVPGRQTNLRIDRSWNDLTITNLNFSYVPKEKIGLSDVTFHVKKGEKIAVIGPSGSGKSTLLKVMAGLIEPESYTVYTDLQQDLSIDDLTSVCLLIPQEPEIFSENVLYNLTMGEDMDQKEVQFFVSLCKLDSVIGKLPSGLTSSLAEKGLNLSVGEKQRMALARGLLRLNTRDILLLDEPTSSLDPKTEKEIYLGLMYHFNNRTVISSCHRLHLVPLFDKIVFMTQSQVLEVGTFAELLDRRGYFYRAWEDYERNIKSSGSQGLALDAMREVVIPPT